MNDYQPSPAHDLEAPYVGNFKSSGDYDAAMLTIRGNTAAEYADRVGAAKAVALGAVMGEFDAEYKATFAAGKGLGATPVQAPAAAQQQYQQQAPAPQQYQPQPPPQQSPPGQAAPSCHHGVKKYVSGNGAKGPYKFWGCPAPKGTPDQCAPQWL